MSLRIIDVSQWQSNFVTDADGIICKATEGTGFVDPTCDAKYQMNKAAGKCLGVYHYARPDLCSAIDEARFFVGNIEGYIGEAVLALDWEQPGTQGNVSWAKAWLDEVKRLTGIKPMIYMSASVVNQYDWSSVAKADYGLWIAGYPDNRDSWDVPDFPYATGAWDGCAMWQFTSSNGTLDRDIFYGDENAWKAYATSMAQQNLRQPQFARRTKSLLTKLLMASGATGQIARTVLRWLDTTTLQYRHW